MGIYQGFNPVLRSLLWPLSSLFARSSSGERENPSLFSFLLNWFLFQYSFDSHFGHDGCQLSNIAMNIRHFDSNPINPIPHLA
jgi:hypothetical protein